MENQLNSETINKKIKLDSKYATGRRKKSIAKVWLRKGSGNIHVNGKKMVDYFQKPNLQIAIFRPLNVVKRGTSSSPHGLPKLDVVWYTILMYSTLSRILLIELSNSSSPSNKL